MKYIVTLKTIIDIEIEANSRVEAIKEAKEKAAWDFFNHPDDWDIILAEERGNSNV